MFTITMNGKSVTGQLASLFMQIFDGKQVNKLGEIKPVGIKARFNALAELVKNEGVVKTFAEHPEVDVEILVPNDFKLTCKVGNLVNTAKLHLAMLDLKVKATAIKKEAEKLYNEVNLKPQGQRGRKAEVLDIDAMSDELTSILEG